MARTEVECMFLSRTGGCGNIDKAGDNKGETPIIGQPWSCKLANKPELQPTCLGYVAQEEVPNQIATSEKSE